MVAVQYTSIPKIFRVNGCVKVANQLAMSKSHLYRTQRTAISEVARAITENGSKRSSRLRLSTMKPLAQDNLAEHCAGCSLNRIVVPISPRHLKSNSASMGNWLNPACGRIAGALLTRCIHPVTPSFCASSPVRSPGVGNCDHDTWSLLHLLLVHRTAFGASLVSRSAAWLQSAFIVGLAGAAFALWK